MPKTRIDYSKTVIYKMVCDDINIKDIYVGHTTSFTKRKAEHKAKYCQEKSKEYSKLLYQFMREHGGWDKFTMVEIEKYPCTDGNEARARERYWFEILQPSLNRYRPSITKEEKKGWAQERVICACGATINKGAIFIHNASRKHQLYLLNQIEID